MQSTPYDPLQDEDYMSPAMLRYFEEKLLRLRQQLIQKEKAISLGNLIGSNIFNISSVLGVTAIIQPITVKSPEVLTNDIFWMIGFASVLIPLAFLPKRFGLDRKKGIVLFVAYAIFIGMTIHN